MTNQTEPPELVLVDTSSFFSKAAELRKIITEKRVKLVTIDLVVFEFVKLMQAELNAALGKGRSERIKMLTAIRDRFPGLLRDLGIELVSPPFDLEDLGMLYGKKEAEKSTFDSGDYMIWLKMKKAGIDSILTDNVDDWKRFGAKICLLD